jgi:general secretion pathway protein H
MVRMEQKVAPAPDRTSRAGSADRGRTAANGETAPSGGTAGFTLLEVVCVVALVAILAAIVVPALPRGTSRARLESFAVEAAAMLKADRDAAIRNRTQVATEIDAPLRVVRSGATGRVIRVPADVRFEAMLAARCNNRPAGPTIRFFASGMSCGGTIALTRLGVGYQVRVNWLTGGVEVVPFQQEL